MWPLFSAVKRQPATAPRPGSQIYGRVQRARTSVSAVTEADVANDIRGHAGAPRKRQTRSSGSAVSTTTAAPQTSAGTSTGSKGGGQEYNRAAFSRRSDTVLLVVEGDTLDPAEDEDPRATGCGDCWIKEESKTPEAPHEILRYSAKAQQWMLRSRMESLEWARERIHFTKEALLHVPSESERFGTLMTQLRAQKQKPPEGEADLARMKAALGEHPSDPDNEDINHDKDDGTASPSLPRVEAVEDSVDTVQSLELSTSAFCDDAADLPRCIQLPLMPMPDRNDVYGLSPIQWSRVIYRSILTKSGMDHGPARAMADAPPRQTPSLSGALTLMAPADNITTSLTLLLDSLTGGRSELPSFRQLWSPSTLTKQSSTKGGTRANRMTSANGDGQAMLELKRQLTRLLLTNSRLRQENSRLTSELADARLTVQVSPQDREDTATVVDDNATAATSNLTDVDGCETVPDHWDDNVCGTVSDWDDDNHSAAEVPSGDEDVADDRIDDAIDGGAPVHKGVAVDRSLHQGSLSNIQSVHAATMHHYRLNWCQNRYGRYSAD
ncbi:hypothetical protein THAOC_34253 [Thalassiosira oceanica]|uniref:Uncharacterized protein n=1 Tax=Thalassiosira oceanica TaxID=159749 RepID=K0R5C6_THAOC|nr:hypothetical protein THAOC_34253 [Thalassiosira oceanica]|eukprot:EJK47054.1 hypothetical protein THAOC_34253 [Thalassiosira oceanica]